MSIELAASIAGIGAFLISMFALAWSAVKYIDVRRSELRQRRFENYHELIRKLVRGEDNRGPPLDSQIAMVFELRNYPEYSEVTRRILHGLRETWKSERRIVEEIDITLGRIGA
jgi:hypothetical protein